MQNTTLTRYQLVHAFILVVAIAMAIYWCGSVATRVLSQKWGCTLIFLPHPVDWYLGIVYARFASFISPLGLVVCWPLNPILIRAMLRTQGNETVTSARDLRFLLLPCLGAILLLFALMTTGFSGLYIYMGLTYSACCSTGYSIPTRNELSALDYISGVSYGFFQNVIVLFIGIQVIRERYLRACRDFLANPIIAATQHISLTRFDVVRAFVVTVLLASLTQWLYFLPFQAGLFLRADSALSNAPNARFTHELFGLLEQVMTFETGAQIHMFAPFALISLLPFTSPVAHLMTGSAERELVDSPRQLRALMAPCIGFFVFVWLLRSAPYEVWEAYERSRISSTQPELWLWCIGLCGWPTLKCSLALALMMYPSIRDMLHQMKSRV